jgi:hypothetical protein
MAENEFLQTHTNRQTGDFEICLAGLGIPAGSSFVIREWLRNREKNVMTVLVISFP